MIRSANLQDAEAIDQLSRHLGYGDSSVAITTEHLENLLNSSIDYIWLFENSNEVYGWIHLFLARRLASSEFYEIGGLVVSPKVRRQGVGRALVAQAHEFSTANNLTLRVRCNARRIAACQFYRELGFHEDKSQQVFSKSLCMDNV